MAEDNVKDKATSTESTADVSTPSSSGINSIPVTSVNSAVDDKKDKSISSGASIQTQASSTNVDARTSTSPSSAPSPAVKVNTSQQEIKYSVEELIKNSKALTGHKREVAVGALFDCKEKELTKDDFKKLIDAFLKRKVK
ncbi:hypothetical protein [Clostridium sp.]|uniref:hypothetical protein n=1 Tax=Clostridium sp. TaxID=1506 RepID=UPI00359F9880